MQHDGRGIWLRIEVEVAISIVVMTQSCRHEAGCWIAELNVRPTHLR